MKSENIIMTITIILMAILFAGVASTYASNPYSYDSDVEIDEDGIDYRIKSSVSSEYDVIVLDNGGVPPINELIMLSTGGNYFENIRTELAIRGFDDVSIKDSSEFMELADHPSGKAILIPYGPIPEEIYSGTPTDPLVKWLQGGGTVYWFGFIPKGGYDLSTLGLSEDDFWSSRESGDYDVHPASPFCESLKLRNNAVRYGLSADVGTPLAYVSESGFSSITSMKALNGTMVVFGGGESYANSMDCAQIIASGVTHDTTMIEHETGVLRNNESGRIEASSVENKSIYVYIGGYYIVYGERHE